MENKSSGRKAKIENIRSYASQGVGRNEIGLLTNLCYGYVCHLIRKEGINIPFKRESARRLKKLGLPFSEICYRTGLSHSYTTKVVAEFETNRTEEARNLSRLEIKILRNRLKKKVEGLRRKAEDFEGDKKESLIDRAKILARIYTRAMSGLALRQIGSYFGITYERIRQIINEMPDFHDYHFMSRNGMKYKRVDREKEKVRGKLLSLLEQRKNILSSEFKGAWAEKKALEYRLANNLRILDYNRLVEIFTVYDEARQSENGVRLTDMAERLDASFAGISKILRRAELPVLGRNIRIKGYHKFTNEQRELLVDLVRISPISVSDMAYFTGRSGIGMTLWHAGVKAVRRKSLKFFGHGKKLGYRLASQIFEAQDLGFSNSEIAELVEKPMNLVDYAVFHRKEIEEPIIDVLRKLYPEQNVEKPYLPKYGI